MPVSGSSHRPCPTIADRSPRGRRPLHVAVAGATGAVGVEFLRLLEEREFPVASLRLLASARSAGTTMPFRGEALPVSELTDASFDGIDLAFFSCGSERTKRFLPAAKRVGALVIDNSSALRMDPTVPLVIPEINPDAVLSHQGVIAVPNCTTIVFLMAAAPLHRAARIRRAVVSSYQAASGAGRAALDEYETQIRDIAAGRNARWSVLPRQLAGNVIPQVDQFLPDGQTKEERKFTDESGKILGDSEVRIAATCVRVPVARAHSVSAAIEFERAMDLQEALSVLRAARGIVVLDGTDPSDYPTPLDVTGSLAVHVGRLRSDPSRAGGIMLFAVGDQLLKGAAWGGLGIAELLIEKGCL